ncbi:GIY-YIG nuclease family protein [Kaistella sp. PBT33-4]|uniref:GIY-YIG nuclease family protein n=1 Tax=Kaistella sp. PBT33-4 TaxID=3032000 RepID=UPI0023D8500F|nr:GIY-YIG nuclease family protein [Kaistella sp. PBT33-4]MDF0719866.1 GIY-YIG nuclease family protein [Kaistella sp. PBT33-4]
MLKRVCFIIYVLLSEKDGLFYTGYTSNLQNRLIQHNNGEVKSTARRLPFKLIYWEGFLNQQDATRREKYLKSGNGKIYLRNRLTEYLKNPTG